MTNHVAAAIRTVQIMCRKTVERMIDLLENESQIEKNVCVPCEIVRRCTTDIKGESDKSPAELQQAYAGDFVLHMKKKRIILDVFAESSRWQAISVEISHIKRDSM